MDIQSRSDMRLIQRAVNQRWPITKPMREKIVASLMTVLVAGEPRDINAACRVLASLDKHNTDLETAADQLSIEELKIALAVKLSEAARLEEAKNDPDLIEGEVTGDDDEIE